MEFLTAWLWYLSAFVLGAAVAWLAARRLVKPRTADEAFADVPTERRPGGSA